MFLEPASIREQYPFLSDRAVAMLHVRRCGWLSAQQLGMYLLDRAREKGTRLLRGRVTDVAVKSNRIDTVMVSTDNGPQRVFTRNFVIAAGPNLKDVGSLIDIDFPVVNELHGKIAFNDTQGVIPRSVPLMIWEDPIVLDWREDERRELEADPETRWLVREIPAGVHFRPEGGPGSHTILALWNYDVKAREPVWPPVGSGPPY